MTLTAKDAAWNQTYTITTKDGAYDLRVNIELPDVGFYNAPAAAEENFIDKLEYHPLSGNRCYVCVNPHMLENGWTISGKPELRAVRYDETGETEVPGAVEYTEVKNGIWEVTVNGCDLSAEATVAFRHDEGDAFEAVYGLWVEPAQQLAYSSTPLPGTDTGWGIPWQDRFQNSLHSALSMEAGSYQDVELYLLVYQGRDEGGNSAGWYCEPVHLEQLRTEGGVSISSAGEDGETTIRITTRSAGTHYVVRLQEEEGPDGEYTFIPGSTRGIPLKVSVSKPDEPTRPITPPSTSGGSGGSDPTYRISVPTRVQGGTIKVTPTSASERQRVTITVKPSYGYELSELTVTDGKGAEVALTDGGDGKYTFNMPKGKASVDVRFQRTAAPETPTQPVVPVGQPAAAAPTNDKLEVDGSAQSPAAYKINDYNYFKLRDLAALLNGTGRQFSVGYDSLTGAVTLTSGQPYTAAGSELAGVPDGVRQAMVSTNVIYIDGVSVQLTAYNIDGYNYFKLRDLASALNFSVGWTAERGMFLESSKPYSA